MAPDLPPLARWDSPTTLWDGPAVLAFTLPPCNPIPSGPLTATYPSTRVRLIWQDTIRPASPPATLDQWPASSPTPPEDSAP